MPNINDVFSGRFLKAHELKGKSPTVTIDRVEFEQVRNRAGKLDTRPIVYFRGKEKGMLFNVTNARSVTQIAKSAITEDWTGVAVTLYPTTDTFGTERHDVIRIKAPGGKSAPPPVVIAPPRMAVDAETIDVLDAEIPF